ncbi:Arabinanase/levansucrase/invertase [Massarina eburnea CBS 473.64]|uniref:Arabinanase/levansucrase/invertase n=1 Tax=Massarina eburnea CBS 473.64 TaxID=1395130 RepID=A0A6A6S8N6_9PLEO|nr:Arabinanase/levansucrase/invertase [Massarina eburnea CBS 473.64]
MNSVQWLWRPKFAKPNGSFWLYGQVDRNVQALKSSSLDGGYTLGSKVTLPPSGYTYSDTGMFVDDDGTWYLLTSADHNNVQINRINSDGAIGDRVNVMAKGSYEAPGMVKVGGIYYLIVSGKTGWRSNPNQMFWTDKLSGGSWNGPYAIAPESEKTYNSQNTFQLTIAGSKKTTYIYMGDSWDSKGGPDSNYVWLPMTVDTGSKRVTLEYHAQWKIDVATGQVSTPSLKRRYDARAARIVGRGVVVMEGQEGDAVGNGKFFFSFPSLFKTKRATSINPVLTHPKTNSPRPNNPNLHQRNRSRRPPMGPIPLPYHEPQRCRRSSCLRQRQSSREYQCFES